MIRIAVPQVAHHVSGISSPNGPRARVLVDAAARTRIDAADCPDAAARDADRPEAATRDADRPRERAGTTFSRRWSRGRDSRAGALYVKTSDPSQMGLCFSLIFYYDTHTLGAKTSTCTTQYECSAEHPPTDMSLPGASLPDVYSWVPIDDCNADSTGEDGKMPDKTHAGLRGKSDICKWAWLCDRGVSNTGEIKPAPAVARSRRDAESGRGDAAATTRIVRVKSAVRGRVDAAATTRIVRVKSAVRGRVDAAATTRIVRGDAFEGTHPRGRASETAFPGGHR